MPFRFAKMLVSTAIICTLLIIVGVYEHVSWGAHSRVYDQVGLVPNDSIGLLLGTSRLLNNGDTNLFYSHRCDAAFKLFKLGKIKKLVISGDSSNPNYDEPEWMRLELLRMGMPDSLMVLDKHGFSTMESLLFCKNGLKLIHVTVISQRFHNERAIMLADRIGLKAVGYNAQSVNAWYGWKTWLREFGARVYWGFLSSN